MSNNGSNGGFLKQSLKAARNAAFAAGTLVSPSVALGTAGAAALLLDTACGGSTNSAPVNNAPRLSDGVFNNGGTPFNTTQSINLTTTLQASDQEGDAIAYRINRVVSGDANGAATISGASLTFVPAAGVEGSQVIEIVAVDGR